MKYKALALSIMIAMSLTFSGCGKAAQATAVVMNESNVNVKEAVTVAKPQEAVDAIYASLKSYEARSLGYLDLTDIFEIKAGSLKEYYGMISKPNEGLADVLILLPNESRREDIQLALSKYKEKRMAEFENYDILDAYAISQNAVIYEQGSYIIMLMLSDNDSARKIIDEYIPL